MNIPPTPPTAPPTVKSAATPAIHYAHAAHACPRVCARASVRVYLQKSFSLSRVLTPRGRRGRSGLLAKSLILPWAQGVDGVGDLPGLNSEALHRDLFAAMSLPHAARPRSTGGRGGAFFYLYEDNTMSSQRLDEVARRASRKPARLTPAEHEELIDLLRDDALATAPGPAHRPQLTLARDMHEEVSNV